MKDCKCINCILLNEKIKQIESKIEEIRECIKKIQNMNDNQIKLIENVQQLISEYKKLKKDCNEN